MCGIVLAGCSQFLSATELSMFEKLVYHDTIRGSHSTGVYAGYNFSYPKSEQYVIYGKTAQTGPDFLESKTWDSVKSQDYKSANNTTMKRLPYFLVGHNRYATMGAKTSENAHPFISGNILLVHNGTLSDQSLLPDWKDFEVDSANICHAINKQGIEKTIQQLDGAFTLVWYDDGDKTLNIIRNEERPFHLARTTLNTWYGASEEEMLMWLLKRDDKYSIAKSSPKIAEHFECEVGVQYVFDVANGKFDLARQIKHELPTFSRRYYRGYSAWMDDDDDDYGYGVNRLGYTPPGANNFEGKGRSGSATAGVNASAHQKSTTEVKKELFEEAGLPNLTLGDSIWFLSKSFEAYPSKSGRGRMDGIIDKHDKEIKVMCHALMDTDYIAETYYKGELISIYKQDGVINLIVKEATHSPEDEDISDLVVTEDSQIYSREDWESEGRNMCANCSTLIPFEEAEHASITSQGYVCQSCKDEIMMADIDRSISEEAESDDAPFQLDTFICNQCGEEHEADSESSIAPSTCNSCYYSFFDQSGDNSNIVPITKELDSGEVVTKAKWLTMNTCSHCGEKVPFSNAEYCLIDNGKLECINCYL